MKTKIFLFVGLLLLSFGMAGSNNTASGSELAQKSTINVYTSPDLFQLTQNWASEFGKVNTALKINVLKSVSDEIPEKIAAGNGIAFTGDLLTGGNDIHDLRTIIVGRDVIVPVMNAKNPMLDEILRKGISATGLLRFSGNTKEQSWQRLTANSTDGHELPLHYYYMDNPEVNSGINKFLNASWTNPVGTKVASAQEMIAAIQNDPNAFGFCKLIQVIDPSGQQLTENIKLVPIDKNGNGKIDFMEDIYANLQTFSRGVWIGKYPRSLAGNIYAVSGVKLQNESELAFLTWVLSNGQKLMKENGFSDLVYNERQSQLDKISLPQTVDTMPYRSSNALIKLLFIFLLAFIAAGFILDWVFRRIRNIKESIPLDKSHFLPVFDENSVVIPKGIYFDKTHTWAFMKKNGLVKIGIDDFLQHVTGPITRIEMKNSGEKIKKGELLLTIVQAGKQLSVYSPVTGTIKTQNESLKSKSLLLNKSPYTDGWVYLVEPTNWLLEVQFLTMAEKYKAFLKDEFSRLKDFLAKTIRVTSKDYELVVMQDGGTLRDCILSGLGPEIWEDFQTDFIDRSR